MEVKKFLITLLIFVTSFVLLDFAFGKIMDNKVSDLTISPGDRISEQNFRLNQCVSDVVVIGSSRAKHHYRSNQLRDSLQNYFKGATLYNLGMDGVTVYNSLMSIESMLDRYHPKLILLDVDWYRFYQSIPDKCLSFAAPFYHTNQRVKQYIDQLGWKEQVKMISSCYRYNGKFPIRQSKAVLSDSLYGYVPLFKSMDSDTNERAYISKQEHLNAEPIYVIEKSFIRVANLCKQQGVELVVCCSPNYRPDHKNIYLMKLCEASAVPFMDFSDSKYFNNHPEMFSDAVHMNDVGAKEYCALLWGKLKGLLLN